MSSQMQPAGNVSEGGTVGRVGFVCALLAAATFALDVKIPLGVAGGAPYAAVVLICLWSPGRRDAIVAAAACSVLTLLSYHFWPPGGDGWQVLINRMVALLAIWVTALLVTRRKQELHEHERQLREHHDHLEELVEQRTTELKRVNARLVDEINDREQAVEALEASEERYRLLIQNLPVGVYRNTPGPKGEFLMANPAHARMMGYDSVEEFLETSAADRYPNPHDRKAFSDKILAEGNIVEEELHLKRRDGSILWAAVTAQAVRDAAGAVTHIDGIIEDITERKESEEKLAWQARELVRSNAELERFAYAVSHDLQEPLRAVAGHCKLLQRRYQSKLDANANELIAHAVGGATRMKALIDGLLAYSRVGVRSVTLGTTDCEEVVDAALANLKTAIDDASATVRRDRLPTVMADSTQLVALFQNLISNAIKYRGEKSPEIQIGAERRHGEWVFCVRDNGIGIEATYRDRIFAVFQRLQTYDECPGTGIGLAICKKIVEGLGGRIWVESDPGQGSSFFFTLPAETAHR